MKKKLPVGIDGFVRIRTNDSIVEQFWCFRVLL